jgi:ubiquinone/menaquinone biosynthesis C-methylase UbiE
MRRVDYDRVAPAYDRRYERSSHDGVRECLHRFVDAGVSRAVAEVGCGTGHWLADLARRGCCTTLAGLDLSAGMLEQARTAAPTALLVRGTADRLPWADASVDRVFCVNALHHFEDQQAFISECRRVLRTNGGLLTIGMDPHCGRDQWWLYDFFPAARQADRQRYPSASTIRDWLEAAGFRESATEVAQYFPAEMSFEAARREGLLDRCATSQLMVITDDDYETGMKRLIAEQPILRADLRLYATTAWT